MELLEAFDLVRCVHSAAELAEVDENTVTRHRLRAFGTKRSWLDRPEACVATGTLVPRRPARPRPNRGAFTWRVGRMTQASNSEPLVEQAPTAQLPVRQRHGKQAPVEQVPVEPAPADQVSADQPPAPLNVPGRHSRG
jgi:hypothetical protein